MTSVFSVSRPRSGRVGWTVDLWDRTVHRVLYSILLGVVAVAMAAFAVPPMRDYTGVHEQVIGLAVLMVLVVEFAGARLHRLVDWLLYGQRHDPASVSARLARPLREADDEHALEALLEALTETLRLTHVSVSLAGAGPPMPATMLGRPSTRAASFPIRRAGRQLGELRAARRAEPLDSRDQRLLEAAAAQIGLVLHVLALNDDIRMAREQLVAGVAEERRRLRREIHDGIGPTLAGIALGVESAQRAMDRDSGRAQRLLAGVHEDVSGLVADVRHVVDGLRPALLDELGLLGALRALAANFEARTPCRIEVDTQGEATTPGLRTGLRTGLPAAVEVAAYRIGAEAITNLVRHAGATHARVELMATAGELRLRVSDDGRGGALDGGGGTGLGSMRERAEEVGGHLEVASRPSGTTITAHLPLAVAAPAASALAADHP